MQRSPEIHRGLEVSSKFTKLESLAVGSMNMHFNKFPKWFLGILKCNNTNLVKTAHSTNKECETQKTLVAYLRSYNQVSSRLGLKLQPPNAHLRAIPNGSTPSFSSHLRCWASIMESIFPLIFLRVFSNCFFKLN